MCHTRVCFSCCRKFVCGACPLLEGVHQLGLCRDEVFVASSRRALVRMIVSPAGHQNRNVRWTACCVEHRVSAGASSELFGTELRQPTVSVDSVTKHGPPAWPGYDCSWTAHCVAYEIGSEANAEQVSSHGILLCLTVARETNV